MQISPDRIADLTAFASRTAALKNRHSESAIGSKAATTLGASKEATRNCGTLGEDAASQLQKLASKLGKSESAYDVDGNGAVNVADLQSMVTGWMQAAEADTVAAAAPGLTEGQATPQSTTMGAVQNISDIVANWGQPGSTFDMNGDGNVNVADLLHVIQMFNQGANAPATPLTPAPAEPAPAAELAIKAAGGVATPAAMEVAPPTTEPTPEPTTTTTSQAQPVLGSTEGPHAVLTIAQIIEQWGQSGSNADINGDGTVNTADLLQLIAQINGNSNTAGGGGEVELNDPARAADVATVAKSEKSERNERSERADGLSEQRLQRLSKAFIERLTAAGYADAPPVNLRELVAKLNLSPADNTRLITHLQKQYPEGLGVNFQA